MPTSPRMPRSCRGISLPPSRLRRDTSASLRYAQPSVSTGPPHRGRWGDSAPAGAGYGFPRQCEHWLGMTGQGQGADAVDGRRGRCPRSGAKRNKYPWGASPRMPRRCSGISLLPRPAGDTFLCRVLTGMVYCMVELYENEDGSYGIHSGRGV